MSHEMKVYVHESSESFSDSEQGSFLSDCLTARSELEAVEAIIVKADIADVFDVKLLSSHRSIEHF